MENFAKNIRKNIVDNDDWFNIGYKMVEYLMEAKNMNEMRYGEFMNAIEEEDERFLFIVLMKNLVSQVNNGGFAQYFFNGYANFDKSDDSDELGAHHELIRLYKKYVPKNEKTQKLLEILNNFVNDICREDCESCDGMGYTTEEETCKFCDGKGYVEEDGEELTCYECNGSGYVEEESTCYECNGSGEGRSFSYRGNDDMNFYRIFDKEMEKIFRDMLINWLENWDKDCSLNQFKTEKNESNSNSKPKLKLVGTDGNAFSILGRMIDCLRHHGYSSEELKAIKEEAISGDYNKVLATACKYCEVY